MPEVYFPLTAPKGWDGYPPAIGPDEEPPPFVPEPWVPPLPGDWTVPRQPVDWYLPPTGGPPAPRDYRWPPDGGGRYYPWPPDGGRYYWPPRPTPMPGGYWRFAWDFMAVWRALALHRKALGLFPGYPWVDLRDPRSCDAGTVSKAIADFVRLWNSHTHLSPAVWWMAYASAQDRPLSRDVYYLRDGVPTTVARSQGWHELALTWEGSDYSQWLDGVRIGHGHAAGFLAGETMAPSLDMTNTFRWNQWGYGDKDGPLMRMDAFAVDGVLVDDMDAGGSGWTNTDIQNYNAGYYQTYCDFAHGSTAAAIGTPPASQNAYSYGNMVTIHKNYPWDDYGGYTTARKSYTVAERGNAHSVWFYDDFAESQWYSDVSDANAGLTRSRFWRLYGVTAGSDIPTPRIHGVKVDALGEKECAALSQWWFPTGGTCRKHLFG